ncbi:unnamed protein product [Closterium sp. NIES-53]
MARSVTAPCGLSLSLLSADLHCMSQPAAVQHSSEFRFDSKSTPQRVMIHGVHRAVAASYFLLTLAFPLSPFLSPPPGPAAALLPSPHPLPRPSPACSARAPRISAAEAPLDVRAFKAEHGEAELETDPARLWERYVAWLYKDEALGLELDISRMGVTDAFVQAMEPKFAAAFKAMDELEKGAISNPDERRMVGHYWLRKPQIAASPTLRKEIEETIDAVDAFATAVVNGTIKPPPCPAGRFTQVLSVGIGGSALGPQFVSEALAGTNPPLQVRFVDNTDPAGIDRQLDQIGAELSSTLVLVISKSGGTPETRNGLLEVQRVFREKGLDFARQGVAITQRGSLLDDTARMEGWLARFPMFDWIGGRTSEVSAVGLLPAALQGINIREMLRGAGAMDEATRVHKIRSNPAALLALCWYWGCDGIGSKDMVVLPYKDSLLLFSRYLQQLIMESVGKEFDLDGKRVNQGLTVYGNKGSTDQHAYIQQLREGVPNFFATFIEVLTDRQSGRDWELEPGVTCGDYLFGLLQGTRSALYANKRESITLTIKDVDAATVGAIIALYERATGLYASLINVNAYHQPGVEAGKKAAAEVLTLQKRVQAVINDASCRHPVEALTIQEIAERAHAQAQVRVQGQRRRLRCKGRGVGDSIQVAA